MKKKNRFLINIALLALSLCIMVYGVYSAKQANLTVSGTIGFTAHNGTIGVHLAGITGAWDENRTAELTTTSLKTGNGIGSEYKFTESYTITIERDGSDAASKAIYFDDVAESTATEDTITPIVLTFTVTNYSLFDMTVTTASLTGTCGTGLRITYTYALPAENSWAKSTDGTAAGDSKEITLTLTLSAATDLAAGAFTVPALTFDKVSSGS